MVRTGVDLIEIERVAAAIDRFGPRFLERIFTPAELAVCANKVDSLAVRFAAKEAAAKALGAGIWRTGIDWTDIEVLRDASEMHSIASLRTNLPLPAEAVAKVAQAVRPQVIFTLSLK